MKTKTIEFPKCCLKTLFSLVLASGLCGCDLFLDPDAPNDDYMEKIFRENRADFERIVHMSNEDSHLTNIRFGFTVVRGKGSSAESGDLGISYERWDEYKRLFRKTELEIGILRGQDGSVKFLAFGKGIAPSSMTKGYLYSRKRPPVEHFECIDEPLDAPGRFRDAHFACKNLDENWYLYLQR